MVGREIAGLSPYALDVGVHELLIFAHRGGSLRCAGHRAPIARVTSHPLSTIGAMPLPTPEEKERFLQYIREGDDRATAAWRINSEYTGSLFRSMVNPHSPKHYDPVFGAAYDAALEERGPLNPDRELIWSGGRRENASQATAGGYTKSIYLSNDQLEHFLELVRDGVQASTAAKQLDPPTSITQINRRATRDTDFAEAFREAKEEGYAAYKEDLRAEATRQAFAGDYRALKDQMMIHLEEARALMTSRHEVTGIDGGAIRMLVERHFSDLPPEMLDEMIRTLEEKELGRLGQGND
jgi:hypothetical protein